MGTKKSLIGAAGLAAALGVGGVIGAGFGSPGISGALQTPDESTTTAPADGTEAPEARRPFGERLAVAADALGMTEDELVEALGADGSTIASIAEERGVDVQEVIDAIVADSQDELVERVTAFVNGELPAHGPGGPGHHHGFRLEGLEAAATAIGTTVDDLRTQLQAGETIASVAEAAGVDVQTVIDAMVADATAEIDEAEAAGRIDAERATELRDALPERIAAVVNGELRDGFGPGHDGPPPPPPADDTAEATD
jgi:uncharacterized protein YidB (DUF937 family)